MNFDLEDSVSEHDNCGDDSAPALYNGPLAVSCSLCGLLVTENT